MRARPFSLARALSAGMASRQSLNIARTFTPLTRSQCSSVISSTKARPLTPALLNRMSMAPNRETAAATICRGASSPVISQAKAATALLPAWACSIADSGRSTANTCAPSSAKSLAEAAPMPDAAPVTIAILPDSLRTAPSFVTNDGRTHLHFRCHFGVSAVSASATAMEDPQNEPVKLREPVSAVSATHFAESGGPDVIQNSHDAARAEGPANRQELAKLSFRYFRQSGSRFSTPNAW